MRTLTADFITKKNKLTGAALRSLLEIDTDSGTLYYSDQTLIVGAQTYAPNVMEWGEISSQVTPGEEVIRISSMPITLSNNPRIDANIRPGLIVRFYIWFDGLTAGDKESGRIFKGTISEDINWDVYTISFTCNSMMDFWDKQIGQPLSSPSYPLADPDDVGKTIPIVYGDVKHVQCLASEAGAISNLSADLASSATTIPLSDATRFPEGGELTIGDESNIFYTGKTGNTLIDVSGVVYDYPQGARVMEMTNLKFIAANHPVKSLSNPAILPNGLTYKEKVLIDSGITLNTDDNGQATIEIASSALAAIREKVGLNIEPGEHFHYERDTSLWKSVAPPLGSETFILSLVVFNNKLYGGTRNNGKLYEWNGTDAWVEVAPQLGSESQIQALAVFNGKIYGGTSQAGKLYEWNGTNAWVEVAPNLASASQVHDLIVFNSKLYGAVDGYLYEWNGTNAWVEVAPNLSQDVWSLAVFNGKIYGGSGLFGKLYEWNGTNAWVEVAPQLGSAAHIYALAVFNNKLYGGTGALTGGVSNLYEWNGTDAWVEVAPTLESANSINSLAVFNNRLYGSTGDGKLFEWNGINAWIKVAPRLESSIQPLAVFDNKLYGGTRFNGSLYEFQTNVGFDNLQTIDYYNDSYIAETSPVNIVNGDNCVDGNVGTYGEFIYPHVPKHLIRAYRATINDLGGGILRVKGLVKMRNNSAFRLEYGLELFWKGERKARGDDKISAFEETVFETDWFAPQNPEWTDFVDSETFLELDVRAGNTGPIRCYEIWWRVVMYETAGEKTAVAFVGLSGNSVADTLGGPLVVDIEGHADDGTYQTAGHYTGTPDALIVKPWDIIHHVAENYSNGITHADTDLAGSFQAAEDNLPTFYEFGFIVPPKIHLNRLLAMLAQQTWCRLIEEAGIIKLNRIRLSGITSDKSLNTDNDSLLEDNRLMVNIRTPGKKGIFNDIEVKYNLNYTRGKFNSPDAYEKSAQNSDSDSIAKFGTLDREFLFFAVQDDEMANDLQGKLLVFYKIARQTASFPSFPKNIELIRGDIVDITTSQLGLSAEFYEVIGGDYMPPVPIEKQGPRYFFDLLFIQNTPGWGGDSDSGWGAQGWGD